MLLPEDPSTVHIMVATGTGIAPFRSYVRRFFCEDVPNYNFKGLAWLFMGVANSDAKLYDDEFQALIARYPDQFRLDYALSREQNNSKGGKMYIQDKVEEYKDQVFDLLNNGAHMYFCGLKGKMPGILDMLEMVCAEKGLKFEDWLEKLKHEGRWVRARAPPACRSLALTRGRPAYVARGGLLSSILLSLVDEASWCTLRGVQFSFLCLTLSVVHASTFSPLHQ